jgi:chemotaxis protein CheZ
MSDETRDSDELEALFDSIAFGGDGPAPAVPAPVVTPPPLAPVAPAGASTSDDDDLQALFDCVAADYVAPVEETAAAASVSGEGDAWPKQEAVFNRIGQMARELNDVLKQLGYDKLIEETVSALPDAKDRLAYVANLTEQAACRVLNATDIAKPLVDSMEVQSKALGARWDLLFNNQMNVADFRQLAIETRAFLGKELPGKAEETNAQLMEIMMAQDFQDLTGQVIKKIVALAQSLENGLMTLLVDVMPEKRRSTEVASLLNGPVVKAEGRDVVVNQQQVDDLLDSLGF